MKKNVLQTFNHESYKIASVSERCKDRAHCHI